MRIATFPQSDELLGCKQARSVYRRSQPPIPPTQPDGIAENFGLIPRQIACTIYGVGIDIEPATLAKSQLAVILRAEESRLPIRSRHLAEV